MDIEDAMPKSPRETANPISKLFFCWLIKLFRVGFKRDLELEDLYRVLPEDRSQRLGDKLARAWNQEVDKHELKNVKLPKDSPKRTKPSLLWPLIKVFGLSYSALGIFPLIEECVLKISQPIFLGYLIRYFAGEFEEYQGYLFASGVVLCSVFYILQHHPFYFAVQHVGMKMRVAACSVIYRKALRLSQASLGTTTIGQMVNFLSNDVNRFDLCTGFVHYLWIAPIQLGIVIYVLWGYFGAFSLAGISILLLFIPFQSTMGRLFGKLRLQVAGKTDRRIRILNDLISAMRVIKMYTWEKPFAKLVGEAREDEIKVIKNTAYLRAINISMFYVSSKVIIFATLLAYVLTGNYLTSEKVFVALSLYNNVRVVLTLFVPYGISQCAEVLVSMRRLETFLLLDERSTMEYDMYSDGAPPEHADDIGVNVDNFSAKWNAGSEELTLSNISFECKRGQLTALVGPVGSGKGSLLQAILRELPPTSGKIQVCGRIAYTSQEPAVFAGSVRQNILFGRAFDSVWYDKVLEVCALKKDLNLLPYRDLTVVGDRGTSLSGGQKARISLARAVYSNADIYLLDDPLSAVDASVGRHLFEQCIQGVLKNKACILVTHQLQFLKNSHELILLNNGKVQAQGTYTELLKTGINFAQLLSVNNEDPSPNKKEKTRTASEVSLNKMGRPEFRRSSSMTLLETGVVGYDVVLNQDLDLIGEEMRGTSGRSIENGSVRSELLQHNYKRKNMYGTFDGSSSKSGKSLSQTQEIQTIIRQPLQQPMNADELRSVGDIGLSLYWKYIRAGSNCCSLLFIIILNLVTQFLFTGSDYWLQYWTSTEEARTFNSTTHEPLDVEDIIVTEETERQRQLQIWIYCGIIGGLFVVSLMRSVGFFQMCMSASVNLHKRLFAGILRAPMRFFEVNSVGRVLNRFSKDAGTVDELLPPTFFDTLDIALEVLGIVAIVSYTNPILAAPSCLLGVLFYFIRKFYLRTARSVKRLEGVSRSPVFAHMSSSLYGLTTIRAFRVEKQFENEFDTYQDIHSSAWFLFIALARWLGICIDWISVAYIAVVSFSFMLTDKAGSEVGLAISSAMTLTGLFQWGVRQSAETENLMISVERMLEYAALDPEAPLNSSKDKKPPPSWPSEGEIRFNSVYLKYDDEAPVLRNITCVIKPKEKIGIVGRTGAGKSSLITTIFRIAEPFSGSIIIDDIDVLKIGLHDLRAKISIIPQDPVLFIGTLRRNLDPFNDYIDTDIWKVLEEVKLIEAVRDLPGGLDAEISEGGSNFSVGQRQLICLGRAILRKNKILVLDEATANVDPETDALIQKTIRKKFAECTVLTVAHRLHTVMDSDRILVLDAGEIKEFDQPHILLQDTASSLYHLVEQTGSSSAINLSKIAESTFINQRGLKSMVSLEEEGEVDPVVNVVNEDEVNETAATESNQAKNEIMTSQSQSQDEDESSSSETDDNDDDDENKSVDEEEDQTNSNIPLLKPSCSL